MSATVFTAALQNRVGSATGTLLSMPGWKKQTIGNLPVYQATTLSWLPGMVQAFTTRTGGISAAPYDSMNLGLNCGDNPASVAQNRERLASALGVPLGNLVFAEQVHGNSVAIVNESVNEPVPATDALITSRPGLILTLLFADCVPIYIVDPLKKVVALIHSGWRGTALNIVRETTRVLSEQCDVSPSRCQVAIGPAIAGENYEVGLDVVDQFRETYAAGASTAIVPKSEWTGKFELHLRSILFSQLLAAGYRPDSIAVCECDTFADSQDFFSHRKESGIGRKTGRMAGVLGIRA